MIIERISHMPQLYFHATEDDVRDMVTEAIRRAFSQRLSGMAVQSQFKVLKAVAGQKRRISASTVGPFPAGKPANERRDQVDQFIAAVLQTTGEKITRTDIWRAAGYRDATDFERFQRNDKRASKTAIASFSRILTMEPNGFMALLSKRRTKN
jgi:hypothetical protein